MPVSRDVLNDQVFHALAHPLQRRRFYLALTFAIILFPLIAAGIVAGTIFLIVPLVAFLLWVGGRVLFARMLGNSVLVSNVNYPRINAIADEVKAAIGYPKPVYIFVYEKGDFNAYMRNFFFRRAIFLNSELLEAGVGDDEIRWLVGRFVGYLRARRQAGFLGWVIRAAQRVLVFNVFLLPYDRALVYTGDRLALAVIDGDVSSAISAMQKLLVGRQLGYSINPEGIIEQHRQVKGSIFAFLARSMIAFPHLTARYVDLMVCAKAFFPVQFAKFETANPGLPSDLSSLAAAPQPNAGPLPWGKATATNRRYPVAWAALAGTTVLGVGALVWFGMAPGRQSIVIPPTSAASNLPTGLPPHVHRNATGQLVPDRGCQWASSDPGDFRVRCN